MDMIENNETIHSFSEIPSIMGNVSGAPNLHIQIISKGSTGVMAVDNLFTF